MAGRLREDGTDRPEVGAGQVAWASPFVPPRDGTATIDALATLDAGEVPGGWP